METTKTTKEALQLLGRYIGQTVELTFDSSYDLDSDGVKEVFAISALAFDRIERGYIKSFRITSLRSLDEMTEEEEAIYENQALYEDMTGVFLGDTAESIHYLESIGIDTMDLKDVTIFIKD